MPAPSPARISWIWTTRADPAVQGFWMLLSDDRSQQNQPRGAVLDGCEQLRDLGRHELAPIEPLRTLRLTRYNAWLARRWDDPALPINFPWFGTYGYWEGQVDMLLEQIKEMQAAPLRAWADTKTPFVSTFFTLLGRLPTFVGVGLRQKYLFRAFFVWFLTGFRASESQ